MSENESPEDAGIGEHSGYRIIEFPREGRFEIQKRVRWLFFTRYKTLKYSEGSFRHPVFVPHSFETRNEAIGFINRLRKAEAIPEKIIHTIY